MDTHNYELNQDAIDVMQMKLQGLSEPSSIKDCYRELEHLISDWEMTLDRRRKEIDRIVLTSTTLSRNEIHDQQIDLDVLEKRIEDLRLLKTIALQTMSNSNQRPEYQS